jgi:hypothetical protein
MLIKTHNESTIYRDSGAGQYREEGGSRVGGPILL